MKKILEPSLDLVLQAARESHHTLEAERICHVIIGGSAVYLHGDVDRQHRDVDLLICGKDVGTIRTVLTSAEYGLDEFRKAYLNPNGVRVEPHWDGKKTRKGKMRLPDPEAIHVDCIDGLPVIALNHLIEMKLQCELQSQSGKTSDPKHRQDIVTLIRLKNLGESYADKLDMSVRGPFLDLVRQTQSQTDRQ